MSKRIFAYRPTAKLTKKQLALLEEEGFIPIAVENMTDIRVVEQFPLQDDTWVLSTALEIIMEESGYGGAKSKFSDKILSYLRSRVNERRKNEALVNQVAEQKR